MEELDNVEQFRQFQAEQKQEELHKSKEFHQIDEVLQKVEKLQVVEELQNVEEVQSLEQLQNVKQDREDKLQDIEEIQELHNVEQMLEVLQLQSVQQVEEQQEEVIKSADMNTLEDNTESTQANQRTEKANNAVKSSTVELSEQTKDSAVLATASKLDADGQLIEVEPPSEEEEKLLLKVLRALLANDELIDIFCEKVISKIAARNDFCGVNCGSTCGGLNKPKTDKVN